MCVYTHTYIRICMYEITKKMLLSAIFLILLWFKSHDSCKAAVSLLIMYSSSLIQQITEKGFKKTMQSTVGLQNRFKK